ncbi:MAG: hypothetical protein KC733_02600 [Candidatus Omnitrophica bacterium]|nr:hypothetical protein [Candidatus Omnitrophota bacterium]
MKKIKKGIVVPSAAYSINAKNLRLYSEVKKIPQAGDVVFGIVRRIGEHSSLENKSGRIHMIHNGSMGIFVFGNRYAPDFYEGLVPEQYIPEVDLLARSGLIGIMKTKNSMRKDPTKIEILGYVCSNNGKVINTCEYSIIDPKSCEKKYPRSKMILVCGTSMNSGKSIAAVSCCWALSTLGFTVRAAKVTGTASLKDILTMNDAGAEHYADFTFLGHPSTYKLGKEKLIEVFNKLDLKYANNSKNYWVVEFADGIIQPETAILLESEEVKSRIHRLIFCASDAFGAIGGLRILKERFNLRPHAVSGVCSSSPLHIRELAQFTDIPVFNSINADLKLLEKILI